MKQVGIYEYFSKEDINKFVSNINNNSCDIFDYLVVEYLRNRGILNFITDDRDFKTVDGINVYYAKE